MEILDLKELCSLEPAAAARRIINTFSCEDPRRLRIVVEITDQDFRTKVANLVFGDKQAGDLGARSTRNHPTTNYGNPSFTGYDVAEK